MSSLLEHDLLRKYGPKSAECQICCEAYDSVAHSPQEFDSCDHQFGKSCIVRWVESSWTCPKCRAPVGPYVTSHRTDPVFDLLSAEGLTEINLAEICQDLYGHFRAISIRWPTQTFLRHAWFTSVNRYHYHACHLHYEQFRGKMTQILETLDLRTASYTNLTALIGRDFPIWHVFCLFHELTDRIKAYRELDSESYHVFRKIETIFVRISPLCET